MSDINENDVRAMHWDLGEWEQALSIHVGSSYCCRSCGNLVMVTRGGVGVLQLACCGTPMEKTTKTEG